MVKFPINREKPMYVLAAIALISSIVAMVKDVHEETPRWVCALEGIATGAIATAIALTLLQEHQ